MKKFIAPLMATALIFAGSAAFADDKGKPEGHKPKHDRYKEADVNGDGFLTKDEMLAAQKKRLDTMFEKTDLDKDGKLSKDEMEKGREEMKKRFKDKKGHKLDAEKSDGTKPDGQPPKD